jgi:NAD+ diphosphatase
VTHDEKRTNFLTGPYVDRRAEARNTNDWQAEALADPNTRYLIARGTSHLLYIEPDPAIAFVTAEHPIVQKASSEQLVLLGWFQDTRSVLIELGEQHELSPEVPGTRFEELRPVMSLLPAEDAGLLAYARALSIWRARHKFCGVCGMPLVPVRAGHALRCTNEVCAHETFPRLDPAIIVLVSDGERALLGRQAAWPAGRYSTLAGFVEPGESLEDAVAREVLEETGVPVHDVRYHSSQPWPFPSSLMIGFQASASPEATVQASDELEHARWFTREELKSGQIPFPPSRAISHRLICDWLDQPGT